MTAILEGVRILEVAEHTFVPAASALMADWGADVIKVEHVERGDAMRGLAATGMAMITGDVHPLPSTRTAGRGAWRST
jgi:crotonobetainyl-CoA:carnitine CoA-transferase CaiB-like acyl-CoA transferase